MSNEDLTERLLGEICYVIDLLPERVPDDRIETFLETEDYYLQEQELDRFADKLINIVIKIQCYHKFETYCGEWHQNMKPQELAVMVRKTVKSRDGFLNILSRDDNMLLTINGQTLHMSVYNPTLVAIVNLSRLAAAEGLFFRRAEN